jgi:putative ATP-binding cassette transporter
MPGAGAIMQQPQPETAQAADEAGARKIAMRRFLRLALGYWRREKRREAWLLSAGVFALVLLMLLTQLGVNQWNRFFFDALDARNGRQILIGVGLIGALALATALLSVLMVHIRMRLQLRWRQWVTRRLIDEWFVDRRFYQLTIVGGDDINPEYRIGEDTRLATEPVVDFAIGLTNALLSGIAFLGILWSVGGGIGLSLGGQQIHVPGYMVWVAILYSLIASTLMVKIGRPLIVCVDGKNAAEAQFRYELTRVRESAENIALIGGDEDEKARLDETFTDLVKRWLGVIGQQAKMTWVLNANTVLAPVAPLLMGAPKYLSGSMTLGELMQVTAAFMQVQTAFNWLVDNAIRLAEWNASSQRVGVLLNVIAEIDTCIGKAADGMITLGKSPDANMRIENLSIAQRNGKLLIADAEVVIEPGEKILVKGESGMGKSTLIRAIAGLWPWGSGRILRPEGAEIAFMPQRPYIPLGTLRHALLYPASGQAEEEWKIRDALRKTGLWHLIERLDEDEQWSRILSVGEQQRIAFARLLIHPPDMIIMDEATSALDELSQARVMDFLKQELAAATVISVAHRPGLEAWHTREVNLVRAPGKAHAVTQDRRYPLAHKLLEKLRLHDKRVPEP